MDLETAKGLEVGDIIYDVRFCNADNSPYRWKVNGRVKTWKRSPDRIRIPVKCGLYEYDYITEDTVKFVYTSEKEALEVREKLVSGKVQPWNLEARKERRKNPTPDIDLHKP